MRYYSFIILNLLIVTILKSSELDTINEVNSMYYNDYLIKNVLIKGNKITKDEVIIRELNLKVGDKFDSLLYKEDIENLNKLDIFNRVNISIDPYNELKKIDYIVELEESPNVLPIPQGGMKEGSLKKIWVGLNFQWKNFRGYNETISVNFGIGYEPFVSLSYFNPWIGNKEHFFGSVNLAFSKNVMKVIPDSTMSANKDNAFTYDVFKYSVGFSIGKYIYKNFKIFSNISYNFTDITSFPATNELYRIKEDNYTKFSISLNYDKRNNNEYTTFGTYIDFTYNRYGILSENNQFNKIEINLKKFIPIRIIRDYFISYCIWLRSANIFTGTPKDYLMEVYGYDVYIRGWKDYLFKGENSLGIFSEFRIPIVKPFYVNGKDHIIIKKIPFFNNFSYQYGLYLTTFFDIGTVYNRGVKVSDLLFKKGYGLGINLLLPFNFIVRVDIALNKEIDKFKSRFSFDLNSYF